MDSAPHFSIGELADIAGVSRRTVRYYVQEGLLPAPLGVGRGNHYGVDHLNRLLRVKTLQEAGRSLDDIRADLSGAAPAASAQLPVRLTPRSLWRRLELAPGVELHVASTVRLPGPGKLNELAEWCRTHFPVNRDPEEDPHA